MLWPQGVQPTMIGLNLAPPGLSCSAHIREETLFRVPIVWAGSVSGVRADRP
jgi:hypothetical protein